MPIKWIDEAPRRYAHLGRVRLGEKREGQRSDGSTYTYPVQLPYFRLDDAPEIAKLLDDEQPHEIPIMFLFDDLASTFPYHMERWGNNKLMCKGDGEIIISQQVWIDPQDKKKGRRYTVRDGGKLDEQGKTIWEGDNQERIATEPCLGRECSHYKSGACKPYGYLRFIVRGAERLGYYDVVCKQAATFSVLSNVEGIRNKFGRLVDIPCILHRGKPKPMEMPDPKTGGLVTRDVCTQWVEPDPEWFQLAIYEARAMRLQAIEDRRLLALDSMGLWDDGVIPRQLPQPRPIEIDPGPPPPDEDVTPGEFEEVQPEPEPTPEEPPEPTDATRREFLDAVLQEIKYFETDEQIDRALCKHFPEQNGAFWGPGDTLILAWNVMYNALLDEAMGKVDA